mmetsp:Transcript_12619/g.22528  ORF Transcript_12619/g.22528 Transcript_12619/m.22528 type:complete len:593 (-) Transcript_12619:485-2263(-)
MINHGDLDGVDNNAIDNLEDVSAANSSSFPYVDLAGKRISLSDTSNNNNNNDNNNDNNNNNNDKVEIKSDDMDIVRETKNIKPERGEKNPVSDGNAANAQIHLKQKPSVEVPYGSEESGVVMRRRRQIEEKIRESTGVDGNSDAKRGYCNNEGGGGGGGGNGGKGGQGGRGGKGDKGDKGRFGCRTSDIATFLDNVFPTKMRKQVENESSSHLLATSHLLASMPANDASLTALLPPSTSVVFRAPDVDRLESAAAVRRIDRVLNAVRQLAVAMEAYGKYGAVPRVSYGGGVTRCHRTAANRTEQPQQQQSLQSKNGLFIRPVTRSMVVKAIAAATNTTIATAPAITPPSPPPPPPPPRSSGSASTSTPTKSKASDGEKNIRISPLVSVSSLALTPIEITTRSPSTPSASSSSSSSVSIFPRDVPSRRWRWVERRLFRFLRKSVLKLSRHATRLTAADISFLVGAVSMDVTKIQELILSGSTGIPVVIKRFLAAAGQGSDEEEEAEGAGKKREGARGPGLDPRKDEDMSVRLAFENGGRMKGEVVAKDTSSKSGRPEKAAEGEALVSEDTRFMQQHLCRATYLWALELTLQKS